MNEIRTLIRMLILKAEELFPSFKQETAFGSLGKTLILGSFFIFYGINSFAQVTQVKYLSGTDKNHTVKWDFFCTEGRNSGKWATIQVPSCWELQGFGSYHYGLTEPFKAIRNERGIYKHEFTVPSDWRGKKIFIVFGGSATDTKVTINGKSAGPIHQGAFYQFKYNITNLLNYGKKNELKVEVSKISSDPRVNHAERRADYWVFGGIYRPVYLEAFPSQFITRVAINAKADGSFLMDTFLDGARRGDVVRAQILTATGKKVGSSFSKRIRRGQPEVTLTKDIRNPKTWNPEFPYLYQVHVELIHRRHIIHEINQKFGFRTIELRKGMGLFINGHRVMLKGVCRHSFWPNSGWTTSKGVSILDVNMMKDMNINAVRCVHSPPDKSFLNVCDSLGLLVLDEFGGWHASYDTKLGKKLVKEFVTRDVNHPSIIFWDNGNEGGWNTKLDDQFDKYDPQDRTVLHPGDYLHNWSHFNGIDNHHYPSYSNLIKRLHRPYLYFPTEFLHGLYAGGSGAGLYDYWSQLRTSPVGVGGFIWDFLDEGVVRTDEGDRVDVNGNKAPDGIVGPFRHEKEGSYYTIKQIWSPIQIKKPNLSTYYFIGKLSVENRFYFTNLDQCTFKWELVDFPKLSQHLTGYNVKARGEVKGPNIPYQQKGNLYIDLPSTWQKDNALFLTAYDPHGREIYRWTWMISNPEQICQSSFNFNSNRRATATISPNQILLNGGNTQITISKKTGEIVRIMHKGQLVSLSDGPALVGDSAAQLSNIKPYASGNKYIVEAHYKNDKKWIKYTMSGNGWLKMDYSYTPTPGPHHFLGITFSYPSDKVNAVKWFGHGPYRVWKDRIRGMTYSIWENRYNDTRTGQQWNEPAFKGYFSNMYWAQIKTQQPPITVVTDNKNLFFRLLTPRYGVNPRYTAVTFPKGNISFLQHIDPIGTKVLKPARMGPEGKLYAVPSNPKPYKGTLYFYFGKIN